MVYCLCSRYRWGCLDIYFFSFLPLSQRSARLKPKTTNLIASIVSALILVYRMRAHMPRSACAHAPFCQYIYDKPSDICKLIDNQRMPTRVHNSLCRLVRTCAANNA